MRKIKSKHFEGMIAVVGNPGHGKTYFLQKLALEYHANGYIVVLVNCGWGFEGALHIEEIEELYTIHLNPELFEERIVIFTDEANSLFPAREWVKTEKNARDYFSLFRHAGVVAFVYATQDFCEVEKVIRSRTEYVWVCHFFWFLKLFSHKKYSKRDYERKDNNIPGKYRNVGNRLFFAKQLKTSYNAYARYDLVSSKALQNQFIADLLENRKEERGRGERPARSSIVHLFKNLIKDKIRTSVK